MDFSPSSRQAAILPGRFTTTRISSFSREWWSLPSPTESSTTDAASVDIYAGARYNYFGIDVDASVDDAGIQRVSDDAARRIFGAVGARVQGAVSAEVQKLRVESGSEEAILEADARNRLARDLESDLQARLRRELDSSLLSERQFAPRIFCA